MSWYRPAAAAILPLALGLSACSGASVGEPLPAVSSTSASTTITRGATVVFVGDSIVHGYGNPAGTAWPEFVGIDFGWNAVNLGCDGGGFVQQGVCRSPIGERAEEIAGYSPDVIVISPSSNDLVNDTSAVLDEIAPAIDAIAEASPDALIIGVNAVWGSDSARSTDLARYDAALEDAVRGVGGVFLDYPDPLRTAEGLLLPDDLHPDAAGQRALATGFEVAATSAGLLP